MQERERRERKGTGGGERKKHNVKSFLSGLHFQQHKREFQTEDEKPFRQSESLWAKIESDNLYPWLGHALLACEKS